MSEQLEYDRVGNIGQLIRDGNLTAYSYPQGRLQEVWGTISGVYSYDASGNALTDRTGFTYTYNHLNLPSTASKTGVSVSYSYDALGNKRKSIGASGAGITQEYLPGGIEYTNGSLDRISTSAGYITFSGSTPVYQYYLSDHLGNVRVVFSGTGGTATVIQQQDYYPFGLRKALAGSGVNAYLYNGKELQGELGQYDYGARFYDPVIGRWNVVDPLAENHYGVSPYAYVLNNPIQFMDLWGLDTLSVHEFKMSTYKVGEDVVQLDAVTVIGRDFSEKRYYGGDGSASFSDKFMYGLNHANQYLPTTHVLNSITYAFSGKDIMGNPMSLGGATLGAASILPIGKIGSVAVRSVGNVVAKGVGKSINQLNKLAKTGKAPKSITRFDLGKVKGEINHVHFDNGAALNIDGTWKHGSKVLTNKEIKFLQDNGWTIPK